MRDRGNGLKAQPAVYRWTSGAGWGKTHQLWGDENEGGKPQTYDPP